MRERPPAASPLVAGVDPIGTSGTPPGGASLARATKNLAVGLGIPALLALPTTLIVSRALGPADKGAWSVLIQYLFLLEQVSALGGGAYLAVRVGQGRSVSEMRFVAFVQPLVVPTLVVGGLLGAGFFAWLPPTGFDRTVVYFVVTLPVLVLGRQLVHVLIGLHRTRVVALAQSGQSVFLVAGVALLYGIGELTLVGALWVFCGSAVVRALVPLVTLKRLRVLHLGGPRAPLRDFVRFGSRRVVTDVEDSINTRLPLLLVAAVEPLAVTGVYSVAIGLMEILAHGGTAISVAVLGEPALTDRRRADVVRIAALCSTVIAIGGAVLAPLIPVAFGSAFSPAVPALLLLLPAVPLLTVCRALASMFATTDRTGVTAFAGALSLLGISAGSLVLMPSLGSSGASAGLLCGLVLQAGYLLRRAGRVFDLPVLDFVRPSTGDVVRALAALRRAFSTA